MKIQKLSAAQQAFFYALTSDIDYRTPLRWTVLGTLLNGGLARGAYLLPVAGYIILYSDYFQPLFTFSALSPSFGFLTFLQRLNLLYYGSVILLVAYAFYFLFAPPLLRNKKSLVHFVSDIITSRDSPVVARVMNAVAAYIIRLRPFEGLEHDLAKEILEQLALRSVPDAEVTQFSSFQFETDIPEILRFYYNWKNLSQPAIRAFIFVVAILGWALLLIPAFELFVRVFGTTIHHLISV